jgi:hypothetical protein
MRRSRFLQRRYLAPKMTITHERHWAVKWAVVAAALAAAAALAGWTYHLGQRYAAGGAALEEVGELREQRDQLLAERDKLQRAASTVDSKSTIEKSVQKELTEQIRTLTAENQKLKDDLSFFEGLAQAGTRADGISLPNVKLETPVPGQLRYRALVVQGAKANSDFSGNPVFAEFGAGRKTCYDHLPDTKNPETPPLKLTFRHYQRVEGASRYPKAAC